MNTRKATQEYRLNQWIGIVSECCTSGQTVSSWCAEHDVDPKKYYYCIKNVRTAPCKSLPAIKSEDKNRRVSI